MVDPLEVVAAAATAAAVADLTALDEYVLGDGDTPPAGMPADCCGACHSCQAATAVAAAWPVFLAAVLAYLRDVGDVDALTVADWLQRDYAPPT